MHQAETIVETHRRCGVHRLTVQLNTDKEASRACMTPLALAFQPFERE